MAAHVFRRQPSGRLAAASLYQSVPFRQDAAFLAIGERTNANGSKAFREAMLAANFDECVDIAKAQARDGAHILDLCVDYVGRDGAADMAELSSRLSTAVTLPIVLDSTEPHVLQAGLEPFETDGTTIAIDWNAPETQKVATYWQDLLDRDLVARVADFLRSLAVVAAGGVVVEVVPPGVPLTSLRPQPRLLA